MNKQLFSEWSTEWFQFHLRKVKINSVQMYKSKIKALNEYFNNRKITDITALEIQEYLNYLAYNNGFSTSTIKKYRITLNKIFKYAKFNNAIQNNPVEVTDLPNTIAKSTRRALNEDEINLVIHNSNIEFGMYVLTLLYTGLRRSECLALRWEDINFEENYISISKSITYVHAKPFVDHKLKNGDQERFIPLPTNLKIKLLPLKQNKGWIFNKDGKLLTESQVEYSWRNYKERTGLEITQHMLRHTYATMLYNAKVDIKAAQSFLGHKTVSVTLDIYTHLEKANLCKQATAFDEYTKMKYGESV